jgi:hypothetical protein
LELRRGVEVGLPRSPRVSIVARMSQPKVAAAEFIDFLLATPTPDRHQLPLGQVADRPGRRRAYRTCLAYRATDIIA